jgi:hypothetical protein
LLFLDKVLSVEKGLLAESLAVENVLLASLDAEAHPPEESCNFETTLGLNFLKD